MSDDDRLPLSERPLRFIDCETLGLQDHHPIIELGILDSDGRRLIDTLIKPPPAQRPLAQKHLPTFDMAEADEKALEYSGFVGSERWRFAPELDTVAPKILAALDGCQVWGHTVQFDVWKLRHWLGLYGIDVPRRLGVPCFNVGDARRRAHALPQALLVDRHRRSPGP